VSGWADAKVESARLRAMIVGRNPYGQDRSCDLVPEDIGGSPR